ncbi:hypothetical protein [Kineococcus indalonis]|uniref:hypothetical protein n=1 Tax=Kineococcus indalonis TaxID=2696566 RepID=UPI0014129A09|nr:hypothetical protein [Kineococcus indalonis]NAZ88342.1 hypothetical protein [Kineococcus indalonis]
MGAPRSGRSQLLRALAGHPGVRAVLTGTDLSAEELEGVLGSAAVVAAGETGEVGAGFSGWQVALPPPAAPPVP